MITRKSGGNTRWLWLLGLRQAAAGAAAAGAAAAGIRHARETSASDLVQSSEIIFCRSHSRPLSSSCNCRQRDAAPRLWDLLIVKRDSCRQLGTHTNQ